MTKRPFAEAQPMPAGGVYLDRDALREAGVEMTLVEGGVHLAGQFRFTDELGQQIGKLAGTMGLDGRDQDDLLDWLADRSIWSAVRRATVRR